MFFYLVGIVGSGMISLSKILNDLNYKVIGVDDISESYLTLDLDEKIKIYSFNEIEYSNDYFYIIGNAYRNSNYMNEIKKRGLKYEYYPKFINNLFNNINVAVSGTHGKTTTTKMISCLLPYSSFLIGDGEGKGLSDGKYFIYEACEYKNTFFNYTPDILIILNIDYDHPDFFKNINEVKQSFDVVFKKAKTVIYNGDNDYTNDYKNEKSISFGFNENNDVYVLKNSFNELVISYFNKIERLEFKYYGKHMIYNFLAAYTLLRFLGYSNFYIESNIDNIKLPKRRNETIYKDGNYFITDYAHHPNEIKCFFEGLISNPKYNNYEKIVIFEPHTISRLNKFKKEYKEVLSLFDDVYMYDVFTSIREKHNEELERKLFDYLNYKKYDKKIIEKNNCIFCFIGAGNIDKEFNDIKNNF